MSSPIFGDLSPRGNPQLGGRTGRSVEVGSMTVGDLHDRSSEGSPPAERVEDSSTCDIARLLAIPPAPPARTGLVASIGRLLHSPWWRRAGARLIGLVVDNRIARLLIAHGERLSTSRRRWMAAGLLILVLLPLLVLSLSGGGHPKASNSSTAGIVPPRPPATAGTLTPSPPPAATGTPPRANAAVSPTTGSGTSAPPSPHHARRAAPTTLGSATVSPGTPGEARHHHDRGTAEGGVGGRDDR